jgi:hypothetical protein
MITLSLATFLPAGLIGCSFVWLIYPSAWHKHLLTKAFLGLGAGLGITSCLFFFWSIFCSPANTGFLIIELIVFLILSGLNIRKLIAQRKNAARNIDYSGHSYQSKQPFNWLALALILLFIGSVLIWLMSYRYFTFMFPHGTFDAYAIWNLKARLIVRLGEGWETTLSPVLNWKSHADYPLLTSANIARSWELLGTETTRVPIVLSGLFTLSTIGILFAAISQLRSFSQAVIASLALLGTPWISFYATTQNAAMPVAYYYLSTIILIIFYTRSKFPAFLILAGLMAGFSAWTKNEGLVFILSVLVGLVFFARGKPIKRLLREISPFFVGLSLPLITISYFKIFLAPPNDLFADQGLNEIFQRVFMLDRYSLILKAFTELIFNLGEWGSHIIPILLVYVILLYPKRSRKKINLTPALITCGITLLGYSAIYLITPHPLEWHLTYSADRLLFHLFPVYFCFVFLIAKTPEEIVGIHPKNSATTENAQADNVPDLV